MTLSKRSLCELDVCSECGSNELKRVYSFSIEKTVSLDKNKPGTLVKSHIEEAKQELKEEKEKLTKKEFDV